MVVIRFPSYQAAQDWYHSDEYAEAKAIRMSASTSVQTIIEGLEVIWKTAEVADYYEKRDLHSRIITSLQLSGLEQPTPQDLSAVDEFHIGGIDATRFVSARSPTPSGKILDIGCGIGGPALFIATDKGCHVIGIDLKESFVETSNHLSRLVGLEDQVMFNTGNALALPFAENEFDAAYMIHVGMNIADKNQLIGEAARVIKPGGQFVIYDVMQMRDSTLHHLHALG